MNRPAAEIASVTERFPALSGLPPGLAARLASEAQLLRVPAGAVIFDANQPCRGFPLLLEGAVRVSMSAPSGREIRLVGEVCWSTSGRNFRASGFGMRLVAASREFKGLLARARELQHG